MDHEPTRVCIMALPTRVHPHPPGTWMLGGGALLTPGPAQQDQVAVLCCTGWGAADGSPEQLLWAVAAHCTHFIDQLPSN